MIEVLFSFDFVIQKGVNMNGKCFELIFVDIIVGKPEPHRVAPLAISKWCGSGTVALLKAILCSTEDKKGPKVFCHWKRKAKTLKMLQCKN
jgi:hypothetical protein